MLTRRNFVATSLAAVAGGAIGQKANVPLAGFLSGRAKKLDRIGIQLYSVRDLMAKDFEGTLASIAQIGYKEVEFAGFYNRKPADIRALLQKDGLVAPSAHLGFDVLSKDTDATMAAVAELGAQYATVAWTPQEERGGADKWKATADKFNAAGRVAKAHGISFAYHNHDFEFDPAAGDVHPLDILVQNTDPALVNFEMDVYWVNHAGQSPVAYISKYPGRFVLLHLKDGGPPPDYTMTDVGSGTIDFASILRADTAMQHVFVEKDVQSDPMGFARNSFNYLNNLTY
jgi:sugar phosphate isomerase/epimerase